MHCIALYFTSSWEMLSNEWCCPGWPGTWMATLLRREIFPNTSVFLGRPRMEALENWTQEKSAIRGGGKCLVFAKKKEMPRRRDWDWRSGKGNWYSKLKFGFWESTFKNKKLNWPIFPNSLIDPYFQKWLKYINNNGLATMSHGCKGYFPLCNHDWRLQKGYSHEIFQ